MNLQDFLKATDAPNNGAIKIDPFVTGGGTRVFIGLGDNNFSPVSVKFNSQGVAEHVQYPHSNCGYSGHTLLQPAQPVLNALITAAKSIKSGHSPGTAMAALARASGAPTPGTSSWGRGLVASSADIDTATWQGSNNAGKAVLQKWAGYQLG